MQPAVYILASARNGTLYIGVTSALLRRVHQHREGQFPGFTLKYRVHQLVWFEQHADMPSAIRREKQLKQWRRRWKLDLTEGGNPEWRDLWFDLVGRAFASPLDPGMRRDDATAYPRVPGPADVDRHATLRHVGYFR